MSDFDDKTGKRTTAYILLGLAGYIVLANTGLLDLIGISDLIGWLLGRLFDLIPTAILLLGLVWVARASENSKPIFAWIVILFGVVLLISQIGLFGLSFGDMFLPLWLVVIAVMIMNPRDLLPRRLNTQPEDLESEGGQIQLVAFMGGGELDYTSQNLVGGEVVAIWGGYKIDFTQADMRGESMELNLFCIMGGVEINVPPNWDVEKRGAISIMGGFSNKSKCLADKLELPRKKLIIRGLALMGGGEIKN